jgi:ubiquinone/menaquinone biosynthesis C-methylase UbiE
MRERLDLPRIVVASGLISVAVALIALGLRARKSRLCSALGEIPAWLYDLQMRLGARQLDPRRRAVAGGANGRILEIGIGTAQNAPFYRASSTVVGIDPDPAMLSRARRRASDAPARIHLLSAVGEALPFRGASFDGAVVTLALCTVESQERSLAEVRRVLKPGAELRFMEHVRSDSPGWAKMQDVATPIWQKVTDG